MLTLIWTSLALSTPLTGGPYSVYPYEINAGGNPATSAAYSFNASLVEQGENGTVESASYSGAFGFWRGVQIETPTPTETVTGTPSSNTPTITNTPTATVTETPTITNTPTATVTETPTITNTPTNTGTQSETATISGTPTSTASPTITQTSTRTPSFTPTLTPTACNPVAVVPENFLPFRADANGDCLIDEEDLFETAHRWKGNGTVSRGYVVDDVYLLQVIRALNSGGDLRPGDADLDGDLDNDDYEIFLDNERRGITNCDCGIGQLFPRFLFTMDLNGDGVMSEQDTEIFQCLRLSCTPTPTAP